MTPNFNSKFYRVFSVVTDEYGIDPLLDRTIPHLKTISRYTLHLVTQDERAAPDLISLREYGTDELWWMMMAYNGVGHYKTIVEGVTLKIPDYAALVSLNNQNTVRPDRIQRVITI